MQSSRTVTKFSKTKVNRLTEEDRKVIQKMAIAAARKFKRQEENWGV